MKSLLQGIVGSDGLYSFPHIQFQPSIGVASYCLSSSVNSSVNSCNKNADFVVNPCNRYSSLWHDRLGHPNHHVLQLVLQHFNIPTVNKNLISFCSPCAAGKSHRLPSCPTTSVYSTLWNWFIVIFGVHLMLIPLMAFYTILPFLMLSLDLLGFIYLKAKLKLSLFLRNLKPWQNCNSIPKWGILPIGTLFR